MTLTVEDGTGLASADGFISVAYADSYHTAQGTSTWTGEDADKETAIRRATEYLSASMPWDGLRTRGRNQALAWPRSGMIDRDGNGIDSDVIPVELQKATAEIALRELVEPGAMSPDYTASEAVRSEKIGPMSVEYADVPNSADARRPVLVLVRDLLGAFLRPGASSMISGRVLRT
jgi:hypothetical protein